MAKKKKNKSRRSNMGRQRKRFYNLNLNQIIDMDFHQESCKEHQKKFVQTIATREADFLNRTIYVMKVKDLNVSINRVRLINFFEANYGPIEGYKADKKRFPCAKLTFKYSHDALKIFGIPLLEVKKEKRQKKVIHAAEIGHRGYVEILPGLPDRAVLHSQSDNDAILEFDTLSISMGHFVLQDGGLTFFDGVQDKNYEFLEEYNGFGSSKVKLNLLERSIIIGKQFLSLNDQFLRLSLLGYTERTKNQQLIFRFKEIHGFLELCRDIDTENISIIFVSKHPPKLEEILSYVDNQGRDRRDKSRLAFVDGETVAPFDHCFAFKLNVSRLVAKSIFSNRSFVKKLEDFGIIRKSNSINRHTTTVRTINIDFDEKKEKLLNDKICSIRCRKTGMILRSILDKGVTTWYDILNDFVEKNKKSYDIFDLISNEGYHDDDIFKALEMFKDIHRPTRFPAKVFFEILSDELDGNDSTEKNESLSIPSYCIELPRVVITPTRTIIHGFGVEISNRIVRHFKHLHFLRVSFADEDLSDLFSDDFSTIICNRFKDKTMNGLMINGEYFRFLAYSSSQLKEKSLWMVSCSSQEKDKIRSWMGDLDKIKLPSKYAARMGQCFSTTVPTLTAVKPRYKILPEELKVCDTMPDIISGEYCHSDGTGLIDRGCLKKALKHVPFSPKNSNDVSIVQVRFGGAKGTLTAWDFEKIYIHGCQISNADVYLRKSMVKFTSPYRNLEIISIGSHLPYYLNRQMIFLLNFHKVPESTIMNLQGTMLDNLDSMMKCPKKAMNILPSLSGPDHNLISDLLSSLSCGFSPSDEPFLFSCLHAIRSHHLMQLRKKTRIHVQDGAVLMGGIDETAKLPEGCVFVKVRPKHHTKNTENFYCDTNGYQVIEGPVLVAKHPVMHPGDVRMLRAVNFPDLHHQNNVILFSQHGDRPETDKMAGSDLDGDQYAVCWDRGISFRTNYAPMNFGCDKKATNVAEVTDNHLMEHFINHAKSETLGRISMLWLDYAAIKKNAACAECLELAKLHSIAVDFPKSGVPAEIPKELRLDRSTPRPHWRELKTPSYDCDSVVGKLYDRVVLEIKKTKFHSHDAVVGRSWNKKGQLLCFLTQNGHKRLLLHLKMHYKKSIPECLGLFQDRGEPDGDCIDFAIQQKDIYENEIIQLMNKYKIHSEGELLTGCIRKFHKWDKRRQHDLAEEVKRQCRNIRQKCRDNFFLEIHRECVKNNSGLVIENKNEESYYKLVEAIETVILDKNRQQINPKHGESDSYFFSEDEVEQMSLYAKKLASSYYFITYNPNFVHDTLEEESFGSEKMDKSNGFHILFSFPWIVADIIEKGLSVMRKST